MESLAEINYYVPGSFPETLARVIREHHHNCRLNLWADQPLSLDGASGSPEAPLWLDMIRSSNLQALALHYPWNVTNMSQQFPQLDEFLPALANSSNLKYLMIYSDPNSAHCIKGLKKRWKLLQLPCSAKSTTSLTSLSIILDPNTCAESVVCHLSKYLELSCLRSLSITFSWDPAILRYIAPSFKRLERLFVGFDTSLSPVPSPFADDERAIETVRSFHPLKFLQLRGPRSVCSLYRILISMGGH
jgi:hypothetical protein